MVVAAKRLVRMRPIFEDGSRTAMLIDGFLQSDELRNIPTTLVVITVDGKRGMDAGRVPATRSAAR